MKRFLWVVAVLFLAYGGGTVSGLAAGNPVEPLSNGLVLTMTADQVIARFGAPASDMRAVGGGFGYGDFGLTYNTRGTELWHLTITGPSVRLSSGIGVGSSRADVIRVFGSADHIVHEQYDLEFQYASDARVSRIRINPANGTFKSPAAAASSRAVAEPSQSRPEPMPNGGNGRCRLDTTDKDAGPFPLSDPAENGAMFRSGCVPSVIVGSWMSQGTSRIDIAPDGTYTSPNGARGQVRANGPHIIFTGPLAAWNNGRAFWAQDAIQFYWRGAQGIQYFAFVRVR